MRRGLIALVVTAGLATLHGGPPVSAAGWVPEVVTLADGRSVLTTSIDWNGDGQPEEAWYDFTGNGWWDTHSMNTGGDGLFHERITFDWNEDGFHEVAVDDVDWDRAYDCLTKWDIATGRWLVQALAPPSRAGEILGVGICGAGAYVGGPITDPWAGLDTPGGWDVVRSLICSNHLWLESYECTNRRP